MCDFCGRDPENLKNGVCPECFMQSRSAIELSKDLVEAILTRNEVCNTFILAAAKALENNAADPAGIIYETTGLMAELSVVDQTALDLLEYIDTVEGIVPQSCYCNGCPYAEDCDGIDCFFDDPDFFAPKSDEEKS